MTFDNITSSRITAAEVSSHDDSIPNTVTLIRFFFLLPFDQGLQKYTFITKKSRLYQIFHTLIKKKNNDSIETFKRIHYFCIV